MACGLRTEDRHARFDVRLRRQSSIVVCLAQPLQSSALLVFVRRVRRRRRRRGDRDKKTERRGERGRSGDSQQGKRGQNN